MRGLVELIAYLKENLKKEEKGKGANLEGDSGDSHVRR
jgi:hypothetical protein